MFKKIIAFSLLLTANFIAVAQSNKAALVSGSPIKNGSPNGIGNFALPSLTGLVMGMATVDNDDYPDLFLQSDVRSPGTYLYHFKKFTEKNEPVFSEGIKLKLPFEDTGDNKGSIVQANDKTIYGFWRFSKTLKYAVFNKTTMAFEAAKTIEIKGLPRSFSTFGVVKNANGGFQILFTLMSEGVFVDSKNITDSAYYTPEGFWPFDLPQVGIYGATIDDLAELKQIDTKPLTELDQTYFGISGYTGYQAATKEEYVLCGTRLGNIHAYQLDGKKLLPNKYVINKEGILQRHPSVNGYPAYFKGTGNTEGLIVSGEGGIYFYENTKQKDKDGNLVFADPIPLLQESPNLYGGSLVVPELIDWDGDGVLDLISGNSAGKLLFFKNGGTNLNPAFLSQIPLKAGGIEVHIQPGYREDIQGPQEARWGYTSPTSYDWNGDGLPDILTNDSRGKFMVFMNKGAKLKPELAPEQPLYVKGMNMFGGWRAKPGVGELDGKTVYINLDRENEFHMYIRIDNYNVKDAGKLKLTDGSFIKANRRPGGQVGRANTHLVDWDGDGVKDLLIGTGRGAAIPNPTTGLPYNRKKKNEGAAVLFLKNAGTNAKPAFEFPKMMKFKGQDILLGAHSCAPTTGYLGGDGKTLNLVVGTEYGTYLFYNRKDLSW